MNEDLLLSSYDYELPEELIAQEPAPERAASRLLVVKPDSHSHSHFRNLAEFLPKNTLLVANNTKVIPARVLGQRPSGGALEFLLLNPPALMDISTIKGMNSAQVDCLLKPSKNIKIGQEISFGQGKNSFFLKVLAKKEFGLHDVQLFWQGDFLAILEQIGNLPLPPYIHRNQKSEDEHNLLDKNRYQTLHSKHNGSLAAPTAGLHFTPELRSELLAQGIDWAELCLHVGYGTFSPVRVENILEHQMHSEFVKVTEECAEKVNKAIKDKHKIIAVGTTSLRTLEGLYAKQGKIQATEDYVNIFIKPGFQFQVINGLLTNFHLPKSSLIILLSALLGRKRTLDIYQEAVQYKYRFFSYGDAMLVL